MSTVRDATLEPKGYQKIDFTPATSTSLTVPAGAKYALIKVETTTVRWRDDGTDPTTTDGMLLDIGDEFWYTGQLTEIEFIETAANAVLHVSYYA